MAYNLHLAVSFTYPRAHIVDEDKRTSVEDRIYFVLESLLRDPDDSVVQAYFSHEHRAPTGDPAAKGVFSGFAPKWMGTRGQFIANPLPVPLPPGTVIQIHTNRDKPSAPFISARKIGAGAPPFGVETGKWADAMLVNGLTLRKLEKPNDDIFDAMGKRILNGDEWAVLLNWAISHLKDLLRLGISDAPGATDYPFHHTLYKTLKGYYDRAVQQTDSAVGVDLTNQAWWAEFLETKHGAMPLTAAAWMLHTAREMARTREPERDRLSFPIFEYEPSYIRENESQLFLPGRDTYAEIFWTEYCKKLGSSGDYRDQQYKNNRSELARCIYGGERLFWPHPLTSTHEADVMRIPGDPPTAPAPGTTAASEWPDLGRGWQWTNTISLLGHCFGVSRSDLAELEITGIAIGAAGALTPVAGLGTQTLKDFNCALKLFGQEAAIAAQGDKLHLRVERPGASVGSVGRIRYQPRMTTLDPDATVPSGYDNRFLTIPKTILDALEERPEWDMPMVDAASVDTGVTPFVRQTPQRIMVTHEDSTQEPSSPARRDILPVEAQVSLFNEAGVLRLRATVTRERLAGLSDMKRNGKTLDHHLLRFRFDTDATGDGAPDSIHSGDLEEMERRAQSPKGALVWFGPPGGQAEAVLHESLSILPDDDPLAFVVSVSKSGGHPKFKPLVDAFLEAEREVTSKMNRVPDSAVGPDRADGGAAGEGQRQFAEFASRYPPDFSFAVEVLFLLKGTDVKRFNAILLRAPSDAPHYIALGAQFNFDSFNCSDTIYRRFYLRHFYHESLNKPWSGRAEKERGSRIGDTFSGSLKAFVYLSPREPFLPVMAEDRRLNTRDHQLPLNPQLLPPGDKQSTNPPTGFIEADHSDRGYEILHSFVNPTDDRTTSTKQERLVRETPRFQVHALAGTEWLLRVRTDTRFGYPMIASSDDFRTLPLFSPVAHPAHRVANLNKSGTDARIETAPQDYVPAEPMLSFDFGQKHSGNKRRGPEFLSLRLSGRYFRQILNGKRRPPHLDESGQETVDPEMRGLRDIYETLLDLFTEIVVTDGKPYSHVTICLELWKFDNRKRGALRRGLAGIAEDAEYPSLVGSLQFVRTLQLALVAPRDAPAEDPRLRLRRYLRRLLIREGRLTTFPAFVDALERLFPTDNPPDLLFEFPLRDSRLQWIDAATGQVYEGGDGEITDLANIVRAGLMIKRHPARVPNASLVVKPEDIHPLLLEPEKSRGNGQRGAVGVPSWMLRQEKDQVWHPTAESDAVARLAIKRLNKFLNTGAEGEGPSELHERFEWLRVDPRTRESRFVAEDDPQLPYRMLGPAYPYAKLPPGLRDSGDRAERIDMFSVPVAFVQFAAIPPFTDRQSSVEYVHFLFDLLQSLCDGQAPTTVGTAPLEVTDPQAGVRELKKARADAWALRDSIVDKLLSRDLLSHVEDDEIVNEGDFRFVGELRKWTGFGDPRGSGGDSPETVAAHKARLDQVRELRKVIFDETDGRARAAIGNLLKRDLRLYARAKGFAIHIFDSIGAGKHPFDERLYSCRIDKYIRQSVWLEADHILEPRAIKSVLKKPPTRDADMQALWGLCGRADMAALLTAIVGTSDEALLKQLIARLFSYMIDVVDLDKELSLSHWNERSLDHWRLDHAIKNGFFDPDLSNTGRPDEPIVRRLTARRNRLIIERILTTTLNPDKPRNPERRPFIPYYKIDNDRFTFLNIDNQIVIDRDIRTDIRFLVDVLQDDDYDSEYEIAHHMTLARSADDVLENKNLYGELKSAGTQEEGASRDAYGETPGGSRSLELVVLPHNPEWREWRQPRSIDDLRFNVHGDLRPVRWYYVLPSRRPPSRPLPLELSESYAGPNAEERTSSDLMTRAGWRNRAQHIVPNAADLLHADALEEAYKENQGKWAAYDDSNPIYLRDVSPASSSGETRPKPLEPLAPPPGKMMTTEDLYQAVDSFPGGTPKSQYKKAIEGWHKLENYIAHVDFEIHPDEEATAANLLDGFRNDTLRIEMDEFPIGRPPASELPPSSPELDPHEGLVGWYQYRRSLDRAVKAGAQSKVVPPTAMTIPKIVAELTDELSKVAHANAAPRFPRESLNSTNGTERRRVTRIALAGTAPVLSVLRTERDANSSPEPVYGHLIDARIFRFPDELGGEHGTLPRVVLRLSFLCCALFNYRVRVKVRRNYRDVDRDGDTDINPRFQINSEASAWVSLSHFTVLRSPMIEGSMPTALQRIVAVPGSETRKSWDERPITDRKPVKTFGDPLGALMEGHHRGYWEQKSPREGYDFGPIERRLAVSALHLAILPDRTQPLHHRNTSPERNPDRDAFRSEALAVATIDGLPSLFWVSKAEAPTVSKAFTMSWHYRLGAVTPADQEMASNLPVLEVHTWPYSWPIGN